MTGQPKLVKLFEPIQIGKLEIKNRIVMPAMANALATEDGYVGDQLLGYFEARARGGAGLITIGFTCIDFPQGDRRPSTAGHRP